MSERSDEPGVPQRLPRPHCPQSRNPQRVGVVGLGRIGWLHAENLAGRVPGARLVSVVDLDPKLARSASELLGVPATTTDDLLADPEIDAVVIAAPTTAHAHLIQAAAHAGKHVFCEKPLADDLEGAASAIVAAQHHGVQLQVGLHLRFDPAIAQARDRLLAGELGDLYLLRISLRDMVGPPLDYLRSSGGLLLDGGIHTLDLARHVGGEIDEISAFGTALSDPSYGELGDVDNALVVVRFSTGALGVIDHSRVAGYGFDCRLELLGSLKSARIEADKTPELQWLSPGWRAVEQPSSFLERFPVAYRLELEAFIAALALGQPVRAGGHEALLAATLCGAANEALRTGRPVPIHASAASAIRAVAAGHSVI